jgi:hypothetical protein
LPKKRKAAQPTAAARRRRNPDVSVSFEAPMLPSANEYGADGADVRRALAMVRVHIQIDRARSHLLDVVARLAPDVLRELAAMPSSDPVAVQHWAIKWGIDAPWVLTVARNTLTLWAAWPAGRGRVWDRNHTDTGALLPTSGRLPKRPGEMLVRRDAFEHFVKRRVLKLPYRKITLAEETSRKAVQSIEKQLGFEPLPRNAK